MAIKSIGILLGKLPSGAFHNLVLDLVNGVLANGIDKIYLFYMNNDLRDIDLPKQVKLYDLKVDRIRWMPLALYKSLKKVEVDVLISMCIGNNISALIAKVLLRNKKLKVIISEHTTMSFNCLVEYKNDLRYKILPYLMRLFYPLADGLYTVNQAVLDDLVNKLNIKISKERSIVLENPIDKNRIIDKTHMKPPINTFINKKQPIILSMGRLVKEKNFSLLIKVFANLCKKMDVKLIILGEGPERKEMERQIHESKLENKIFLPGFYKNPWCMMVKSDIFILPSIQEGFGLVLVEAMICGIPVIATDAIGGGPKSILQNGRCGYLVANSNAKMLELAIINCLKSKQLCEKYVKASKERIQVYQPKQVAKRLLDFIEKVT